MSKETWIERKNRLKRKDIMANTPQEIAGLLSMLSLEHKVSIKALHTEKQWEKLLAPRGLKPSDITVKELKLGIQDKKKKLEIQRKEEAKAPKKSGGLKNALLKLKKGKK